MFALKDACDIILQRLEPIKNMMATSGYTWEELITQAYLRRVPLSATGFATFDSVLNI